MAVTETAGGEVQGPTPVHLWIIGILALLWNSFGAFDYLATQLELEFYMKAFSEEQLAYFYGFPSWVVAAWAFGVWGAVAGSVGLLLRKKWAVWAFAISLAGMAVSSVYSMVLTDGIKLMGQGAVAMNLVIWAVAIFLLVYAWTTAKRGVLR